MADNTNISSINTPLAVVLIGCGRVAEKHLKAISKLKGLELKAVVDVNPESSKRLLSSVKGFSNVKTYSDYKTAIDEIRPAVVSVTVPSGLHYQIARYAMEHGANLLLEKPMTMSVSEAREMFELSKKTGLKIAMGHIYRYLPIVGLVREDIAEGKYGKVTHGTIYVRWGHGEDYYSSAAWRGTWKSDGGALMNQTIHAIDLLVWLMGSEPEEAQAMIAKRLRNIEAEDLGMAVLRLENGALAQIEGTTATIPSKHTAEFSVFCENGQLSMGLDSGKPHLNILSVKPNGKTKKMNGYYIRKQFKEGGLFSYKCALNPHLGIYKDLYDSILENKDPIADAYSGFSSVDTLLGIYKSAKEERPVALPLTDDFDSTDMTGFFG
ncbi:MAG: Gfo/Idh/MocA family oxidoreductase [Clostridiales bacterium]|nr:Gfo/Idh/MocA family oxidoreductase [Clostridiales bacterium]